MTTDRKDFLRRVMLMAWSFQRAEPGRRFGDCLKGAWGMMRGLAQSGAALMRKARGGVPVRFSPFLTRSPIARSLAGRPYAGSRDRQASYLTSKIGA